jgi:predicted PurR-regulated permease PerM
MSYGEFVKRVLTVFALAILVISIWHLRNIVLLTFLSIIMAVSLNMPVNRFQQWGVRRDLSIVLTLILVSVLLLLFLSSILPVMVVQMVDLIASFPAALEDVRDGFSEWYLSQSLTARRLIAGSLDEEAISVLLGQAGAALSPVLAGVGNVLAGFMTHLVIVIIVSIFLLADPKDYIRGSIMLLTPRYRERALEVLVQLRLTVTTWMSTLTISISITVFLVWVFLGMILGVPNALALGVIAGVATIIPMIGVFIPLVPIVIFTSADNPAKLPVVIIVYLVIQFVEASILTPAIVKRQLSIPAAVILLFQLVAATTLGFLGVLLAVPLLATIITLVRELYVYDALGMRGVRVDIEQAEDDALRLVTHDPSGQRSDVLARPAGLRPEDSPGWLADVDEPG